MRLARDQQHAQPVAHAVHLDQGGVVAVGQLALGFGQGETDHIAPPVGQGDGQFEVLANGNVKALRVFPIDRDIKPGQPPILGRGAQIVDAQGQGHRLADNGKGGRIAHGQTTIPILGTTCLQQVQRRGQVERQIGVMHPAIADCQNARDPRTWLFGQCISQGGHQPCSHVLGPVWDGDPAQFSVGACSDAGGHRLGGGLGLIGTVGKPLAGAFVFEQQDDVAQRRAVFGLVGGASERRQNHRCRQSAQRPA